MAYILRSCTQAQQPVFVRSVGGPLPLYSLLKDKTRLSKRPWRALLAMTFTTPQKPSYWNFMQGFRLLCGKTESYAVAKIILPEQTVLQ